MSGLLKLIPGVGSLVGGAISATTAASITTIFGEAYIAALSLLFDRKQELPPSDDEVAKAFSEELSRKRAV